MKKFLIYSLVAAMTVFASVPAEVSAAPKSTKQNVKKNATSSQKAAKSKQASKQKQTVRKATAVDNGFLFDSNGRLTLGSASALVLDQMTGTALVEKNPGMILPIASISKLMTAMVVLDARLNMEEVISIADADVDSLKGSSSRLPVGVSMTRDTALLLALMSSENRAAHALARHYPGGLSSFVAAMNRKAKALGLTQTRFEEPTGLSFNNVSTARDLSRMVMAAHQYPLIREYSTMAGAKVDMGNRVLDFTNTNTLVKNPQWQIGLSKTGYISEAGRCLVMQAWVAGKPVVMVFLDSNGKMTRVGDANRVKRWMEGDTPRNTGA
jgi:D-alanyl-D-alanine endopeptidase (penicillin-binding protein 7)